MSDDDARDVYLFTVTAKVSFTFTDPNGVRDAALATLTTDRYPFMTDAELEQERDRVGRWGTSERKVPVRSGDRAHDPRTTRRYDHARGRLDRHASYTLASHLG